MATQAAIPSTTPTVLVECGTQSDRYFAQTTLPYSATECVADLLEGQHDRPMRVLLIDPTAGVCQDISVQIAEVLGSHSLNECARLDGAARDFAEHHAGLRPAQAA